MTCNWQPPLGLEANWPEIERRARATLAAEMTWQRAARDLGWLRHRRATEIREGLLQECDGYLPRIGELLAQAAVVDLALLVDPVRWILAARAIHRDPCAAAQFTLGGEWTEVQS